MAATLALEVEILEYLELEAKEARAEHKLQEEQPRHLVAHALVSV